METVSLRKDNFNAIMDNYWRLQQIEERLKEKINQYYELYNETADKGNNSAFFYKKVFDILREIKK